MADDELPLAAADEGWAVLESGPAGSEEITDPRLRARLGALSTAVVPGDPTDAALTALTRHSVRRRARRTLQVLVPVAAALILALVLVTKSPFVTDTELRTSSDGTELAAPGSTSMSGGPDTSTTTTVLSTAVTASTVGTAAVPPTTPATAVPPLTVAPPPGSQDAVVLEVRPRSDTVRVGERLLVDLVVHNNGAAIVYFAGGSTCPSLGRLDAFLIDRPQEPIDYIGKPMVGRGTSVGELASSANQLTNSFGVALEAGLDPAAGPSGQCTADIRTITIGTGETVTRTVAVDADVVPGPLERDRMNLEFAFSYSLGSYLRGDTGEGDQVATARTSVTLIDDEVRSARLAEIYQVVDADPRVRGVLDASPDQQYLARIGYHRGQWVFDLLPFTLAPGSGGQKARIVVDPATTQIVSFATSPG